MKFSALKRLLSIVLSASFIFGSFTVSYAASADTLHAGASSLLKETVKTQENESSLYAGVSNVISDAIAQGASNNDAQAEAVDNDNDSVASGKDEYGYKNLGLADVNDYVNIRKKASSDSDVVGRLEKNAACEILSEDDGWYKIKSGDVKGYVKAKYIITGEKAEKKADKVAKTVATVTADTLNVRAKKDQDSSILTQVAKDTDLTVLAESDNWVKVKVDGKKGYVSSDYVEVSVKLETALDADEVKYGEGVSDVRSSLVSYALQFVGNPYVWGGTSLTNGCDCSGFTLSILGKYGVYLPHSSSAQPAYGHKISASAAQPGDLFFYGSGSSISHVAIYIGGGQVVHASNERDGIKVSNAYYRSPICVVSYF